MRAWKMHGVIGTWHAAGGETQKITAVIITLAHL